VPAVPGAHGTALTKAQAAEILVDQRAAALAKDRCSKNWKIFYDNLKNSLEKE
jgi:hypothetical protein